jgi:hypothetical protein
MKGIFWNNRGLADLAKRRFLAEASIEHQLDFMDLLETGRDNFTPHSLVPSQGGLSLTGTACLQGVDPMGFYLGLSVSL